MFWCVSFSSGAFLNSFATARNLVENAPNWCNCCKSSCNDFLLKFFATNAPDPHHWTLNSFFGAFLSVWLHLEPFRNCTKLGAKWANLVQLMQEFVPQSLIRISRKDTPDPHNWTLSTCFHAFLSFWVHLGPLCYCTNLMQNTPNWCN